MWVAGCQTSGGVKFPTAETAAGSNAPLFVFGALSRPDASGPRPAVVLLHTCGGVRSHVAHDWPRFLTGLGYVTLTVDSYGPRGVSSCTQIQGYEKFLIQAIDAYAALNYLAGQDFVDRNRIAVMGFSAGAIAINSSVLNGLAKPRDALGNFRAAIGLYGRCTDIGVVAPDAPPVLEIVAEQDKHHTPSCIEAANRLDRVETYVVKGSYHAFDQADLCASMDAAGSLMQYSARAVDEAREQTKRFLARHLGP